MKYTPAELQACWNSNRGEMLECVSLEIRNRRRLAEAALERAPVLARWAQAINRINNSPFLTGHVKTTESPDGFVASFDWLIKPDTLTLIEEGTWDHHDTIPPDTPSPHDESYWDHPRPDNLLSPEEVARIWALGPLALARERSRTPMVPLRKEEMMILINNNGWPDEEDFL